MIQGPSRGYRVFLKSFEKDSPFHRGYDNAVSLNMNFEIFTRFFIWLYIAV
jgi:hypothetical protein